MPLTFKGKGAMVDKMRLAGTQTARKAAQALRTEGELVMTQAKANVPRDTGTLRNSGRVEGPIAQGKDAVVKMSFSGPHAIPVHEHPSKYDPPSWRGGNVSFSIGGPKYLERALKAAVPGIAQRIGSKVAL